MGDHTQSALRAFLFSVLSAKKLLTWAPALLIALATSLADAQGGPGLGKIIRGAVTRLSVDTVVPVPGALVVLHRVGSDSGGVVDSVRASSSGQFRIIVRPFGGVESEYMLVSSWHGVAYVARLGKAADLDTATGNIMVFDSTRVAVPVSIIAKNMIVFAPVMGGRRRVAEVIQIANDSSVTRVSTGVGSPVWQTVVPRGAAEFIAGYANANPHALRLEDGEVRMYAPFAPGVVDLTFSYTLPTSAFPMSEPVEKGTEAVELILEEKDASAAGPGLADQGPFTVEGKNYYHRYSAANIPGDMTMKITVPGEVSMSLASYLMIVVLIVGVGMLVALAVTFRRRTPVLAPAGVPAGVPAGSARLTRDADAVARSIAELDDAHAARADASDEATAAYKRERQRLKKNLAALLARQKEQA